MSEISIRDYHPDDAPGLSALYEASVRTLGATRYTPDQVEAWLSLAPSPDRLRDKMADGRLRLVADGSSNLMAFIDIETDGHIDLLYAAPESARTGVAVRLYQEAEARVIQAGVRRLYAEASELARPFFERRGFVTRGRRDFEVAGVAIHNFIVEKAPA